MNPGTPRPLFGEPWDAPSTDGARRVDTPLGQPCWWCEVDVADGDQGFVMAGLQSDGSVRTMPIHRECMVADTLGHLLGCCGQWADTPTGRREMALEAWSRLMAGKLRAPRT